MHTRTLGLRGVASLLATAFLLSGCAALQSLFGPPAAQGPARLSSEIPGGPPESAVCTVSPVTLVADRDVAVAMSMSQDGDGSWCAVRLSNGGAAYPAGLLTRPPEHGRVYIHPVLAGSETSIDYTPAAGFVGTDRFTARVLPTHAGVAVTVTVERPAAAK